MGRNPLAVDLVGARLLGYDLDEVPYLRAAVERGYRPGRLRDVTLLGDVKSIAEIDRRAKRVGPYDEEFYRWQDVEGELKRLGSHLRFYWGPTKPGGERCLTGCVMGLKMYFGFTERFAGSDAFRKARPAVLVIGVIDGEIDAGGNDVFLLGSCARACVVNARKVVKIDSCTTTAVEMTEIIRGRLGIPTPLFAPSQILPLAGAMLAASWKKLINLRYGQDALHFLKRGLLKKI
jgi:hypothetical protein